MLWVKGELLTDLADGGIDPAGHLSPAHQPGPFDRLEWFRRVARFRPDAMPLIARVRSEGAIAWLFLARLPGNGAEALANWYSFAFRPVFAGDPDDQHKFALLVACARRLKSARPAISALVLAPVPEADGSAALLARAFGKGGWLAFLRKTSSSWTIALEGKDFSQYWADRPGQLRSTFKRKSGKADFATEVLTSFDPDAWTDYESVYQGSWKPEEGAPDFLEEWAREEGAAGRLRLGLCRLDGRAVAAQFWTVDQGTAYIHKLAYLEEMREFSPGTVLSEAMFRHVIDRDKVSHIDFGTGDDGYKADWMGGVSSLMRVELFNPRTVRGLAGAAKAWIKGILGR